MAKLALAEWELEKELQAYIHGEAIWRLYQTNTEPSERDTYRQILADVDNIDVRSDGAFDQLTHIGIQLYPQIERAVAAARLMMTVFIIVTGEED